MNTVKKRIISMSTALVMVLALVVGFIPMNAEAKVMGYTFIDIDGNKTYDMDPYKRPDNCVASVSDTNESYTVNVDSAHKVITFTGLEADSLLTEPASEGWTFVFNGTNKIVYEGNAQFSIKHNINIQVNKGGSLVADAISIECMPTFIKTDVRNADGQSIAAGWNVNVTLTPAKDMISTVSPKITVPAGNKTFDSDGDLMSYVTAQPEDGAGYTVAANNPIIVKSVDGTSYSSEDFPLTIEEGKEYYASVTLNCKDGYKFNVEGNTLKTAVNPQGTDVSFGQSSYSTESQAKFTVKFKVPKKSSPVNPVTPGDNNSSANLVPIKVGEGQTILPGASIIIGFDKDYIFFKDGGEVYLDGVLLYPSDYISHEGSTIIELLGKCTSKLSNGEHTLKVVFNDKSEGIAKFNVSNEATKSTNITTQEAATTKVTAPKTSDNVLLVTTGIVIFSLGIGGVVIYKRKRRV